MSIIINLTGIKSRPEWHLQVLAAPDIHLGIVAAQVPECLPGYRKQAARHSGCPAQPAQPWVITSISYLMSFDEGRGEDTHGEMGAKVASDRQLRFTNDKWREWPVHGQHGQYNHRIRVEVISVPYQAPGHSTYPLVGWPESLWVTDDRSVMWDDRMLFCY